MITEFDSFDVIKKITYVDLWEAIWSADGIGLDWIAKIRQADGESISLWTEDAEGNLVGNPQDMRILDIEGKWHDVSLQQLADGYRLAQAQSLGHCFGYPLDVNDPDGCFGYLVLQLAIYGELVYG